MKNIVDIMVFWDENYSACPANDDICVLVTHKTLSGLKKGMEFSLRSHIKWMLDEGDEVPEEFRGEFELHYILDSQALLKSLEGLLTPTAISRLTGINTQQIDHYATGRCKPRKKQQVRIANGLRRIASELIAVDA